MEMGAKVPAWLPKILNATVKAVEVAGEMGIPQIGNDDVANVNAEDLTETWE